MSTTTKVLVAAVLTAVAAAAAIPALTGAKGSGARTITARDKVQDVRFVHSDPATKGERLDLGDRVITRQATFDEKDKPTGTLTTDCVNVGAPAEVFQATLQCTSVYGFKNGQIVSSGVVRLDSPAARIAVTGGTGAYANATGDVGAGKPVKGYDTVDVIRLGG